MPQMNIGGKFIFGKSLIRENGIVQFPKQAVDEYDVSSEGKVILFTGSKSTGGFCVTRKGLLEPSKLGHILTEKPALREYKVEQGSFIKYKGRSYTWIDVTEEGIIQLSREMMGFLKIKPGMKLLSIRSSDIAFTMGAYGRLVEESMKHEDEILVF